MIIVEVFLLFMSYVNNFLVLKLYIFRQISIKLI